jgi:hypothetical protein
MDSLTNFSGKEINRKDFSSNWSQAPKLGRANDESNFIINGELGGIVRNNWDSVDRFRFVVMQPLTLTLNLDSQTISEIVSFDSAGNASVVGGVEYGSSLQLQLAPGRYGLSLFVEGDLVNYQVQGQFY